MADWMTPKMQLITGMYRQMPGAVMPPSDERGDLWGEVDNTDYWAFCERVAEKIERLEQANAVMSAALEAVRNAGAIGFHLERGENCFPRLDELMPEVFDQVKAAIVNAKAKA